MKDEEKTKNERRTTTDVRLFGQIGAAVMQGSVAEGEEGFKGQEAGGGIAFGEGRVAGGIAGGTRSHMRTRCGWRRRGLAAGEGAAEAVTTG